MMASERLFSLTEASALFKIKYEKLSENVYNSANVLLGRCKKSYNFTGKQLSISVPQSFSGGVGSGSLPKANTAIYGDAQITSKKMYAIVELDRETIKAALSDEGAFVRATKEVVQKGVESFMRNLSRCLFNDGTGLLGTSEEVSDGHARDLVAANSDGDIVVPIASMKEANFEERDLVDVIVSASAASGGGTTISGVEIVAVDTDNDTVLYLKVKLLQVISKMEVVIQKLLLFTCKVLRTMILKVLKVFVMLRQVLSTILVLHVDGNHTKKTLVHQLFLLICLMI